MHINQEIALKLTIQASKLEKPVIAVDFDAVIHQFDGDINKMGPPIEGALAGIKALQAHGAEVVVYTARPRDQVVKYLAAKKFPPLKVTNTKPIAKVYLDDRGFRFDGKWTNKLVSQLLMFTPYWEKPGMDADGNEWFETYGGIHVPPTYHPPSLKNVKPLDDPTSTTGWKKKDSKGKKKMAREDMREIVKRTRRQIGKPEVSHTAIWPQYPNMYTWF